MKLSKVISFKKGLVLVLLLLLLPGMAQAQKYHYESVQGDDTNSRIYTLKNGLKVYVTVNKAKPRIQTYIAVRTGSRNDPHETTGLAHYLEHLMFKGTTHFGTSNYQAERPLLDSIEARFERYRHVTNPLARKRFYHQIDSISQLAAQYNIPNEYDKMMASIGGEGTNAYTSNDVTCYVVNIPSNELDTWARVEGDRFQNMVIRGFHTELEAVYEEYNMGLAQDNRKLYTALLAKLYPGHPYGTQSTIGLGEHLKNPSISNIKKYFSKYYVPNNIAVCLAGDIDPDQAVAVIDKYFGSWKGYGEVQAPQYPALLPLTQDVDTTVVGQEAASIALAWRSKAANELQNDTLDVISNILSNGSAGLLDLNLVQRMKLQSAAAFSEEMNDYSAFAIMAEPVQGQSLADVKKLLLSEIDKLKKGEFSDELLPSVINNYKLDYYKQLDNNEFLANRFVDAFINHKDWKQVSEKLARISKITKPELVAFANKFFSSHVVTVYKEQGNDTTIKKVEKPSITPIPTNNDKHSKFLEEIVNTHPTEIQPQFVDYKKDLAVTKTANGLPLLYKQNTKDGLFTLRFVLPIGTENEKMIRLAAGYLDVLGTDKLTNEQVKQQFYKLACSYSISEGNDETSITLSGLNENLPQALSLLNSLLRNAKPDKTAYDQYISIIEKTRMDAKKNQRSNFGALFGYGLYGSYNSYRNMLSVAELRTLNPQVLLDNLKKLQSYQQTVLYYGPSTVKELNSILKKNYVTADAKHFAKIPDAKPYVTQATPRNEILIAPYDAKNIYMVQLHNEDIPFDVKHVPLISLFNEYFGGGMNAIVFQELREARGLAYSASAHYSYPSRKQDKEYFYTQIITQNDKMMDCIKEFNSLLDHTPEREAGFNLAKQSLMKSLASARTTKFGILSSYFSAKKLGLDTSLGEITYKAIPSLTLQDVMNFAKENISNKPFKYLILGNEKELDIKALEKIAPIKRVSTETLFGY